MRKTLARGRRMSVFLLPLRRRVARTMDGLKSVLLFNVLLPGVACDGWSVWMPGSLEALADSCLLIPCSFDVPDDHADGLRMPAGGVWRKRSRWFEGSTDVFNSSREQNILSGRILGDLLAKNCTTILHGIPRNYSDSYFFRLETGFKLTFETNVNIDVKDLPQKPQLSAVGPINEGTERILTCRAPAPCPLLPPRLSWTPWLGDAVETLEENKDGTKSVLSVLNFTVSHLHHEQKVTCTANYSLQKLGASRGAEQSFPLTILYSPKNTSATVSPSSSVEGGTWVTLLCSSNSNPPVENYTWFQVQGDEVTPRATGQNFTFNLTATNTGLYYCEAQNQYGTGTSSRVLLTLKGDWNTVLLWAGGGISTPVVLIGVLLCLIRSKKRGESSGSVKTEGQKGGDCHFYGNVDPKVDFKVRPGGAEQSKQGHDDDTYNNSMMMFSAKASCLTNQSGNACAESIYANSDSDGNIYINSISQ
ncbi:myelin-associated glycoprotein-like isoform X2 [Scleropages formosus]|uniref:myelin-associated glycoprotein-like isoform X2 n=1 Tax=Scleropages formosus TaxID=113540 RepID=UPI000878519A|nr:myelin-associated glycoprotein-like isoform X2 [Scleropages formosus]